MNKLPECERPSVSLLACRRAQHATPQPKRSADCPRSRGVYATSAAGSRGGVGSSPLARGLPKTYADVKRRPRIIPARAGFTALGGGVAHGGSDHPRSRGVYADGEGGDPLPVGSSPLARGLRGWWCRWPPSGRIIPARAGFTRLTSWPPRPRRDHPRSRGVYRSIIRVATSRLGSSPLARGLPVRLQQPGGRSGIIPARAGFTGWGSSSSAGRGDHPRSRGVYT